MSWLDVFFNSTNATQIQGRPFLATAPTSGQVAAWNGSAWAPASNAASAAGSTSQIQYNASGSFAASNNLTFASGILAVGASTGGYVSIGVSPASTGDMRLQSSGTIYQRNHAGSADLSVLSKDTSDNLLVGSGNYSSVIIGDATNVPSAYLKCSSSGGIYAGGFYIIAYSSGYLEFPDGSNPGAQSGASNIYSATGGHPSCVDSAGNVSQMETVAQCLTSDFTTTNLTATATNLSVAVKSGETWDLEFHTSAESSSSSDGVKYQVTAPGGSTGRGRLYSTSTSGAVVSFQDMSVNALNTNAVHTATSTIEPDIISFNITAGADGNITLAVAAVTGGTATVKAFSRVVARLSLKV